MSLDYAEFIRDLMEIGGPFSQDGTDTAGLTKQVGALMDEFFESDGAVTSGNIEELARREILEMTLSCLRAMPWPSGAELALEVQRAEDQRRAERAWACPKK